jgi:hypothetical protein
MVFFRAIDGGDGPTKLFIGGVHGKENYTTLRFFKLLVVFQGWLKNYK